MTVQVAVTGATGRMGQEVVAAIEARSDCAVAVAVSRQPAEGASVGDVALKPTADLGELLEQRAVDVLVDFTVPTAAVEYAAACAEADVAFVTGTTGLSDAEWDALREPSDRVPVLHAPNFSRGIQVLLGLVGDAVAQLPGYDVELVEAHHNRKRDAPSGTANRLLEQIESSGEFANAAPDADGDVDQERTDRVHGREGDQPREVGEIGVHAIRAGDITGTHEVMLAANDEVLTLGHRAEDRHVFAAGAVDAAVWIAGRKAGWYEFADVISQ